MKAYVMNKDKIDRYTNVTDYDELNDSSLVLVIKQKCICCGSDFNMIVNVPKDYKCIIINEQNQICFVKQKEE
jgi:threonine dehydrogenase-like Zn-dependent dehydrogenase